ncbi:MAG: hypothetical protein V3U58_08045 [Thermodesulfobacteriota bacterium]
MVATKKKAGRPRKVVFIPPNLTVGKDEKLSEAVSAVIKEKAVSAKNTTTESVDKQELAELRKLKSDYDKKNIEAIIKKTDYEYFADFDKGSSIPAWSLTANTDVLDSEVSRLANALKRNEIPLEEVAYAEEEYKMKKERLEQIHNSKPKLSGRQVDELKKKRDALSDELTRSKFTRLEMERGLADPHVEADRMSLPCIKVDREEFNRMGISVAPNGKVSRSKAEMGWKMMNGLLGDGMNANTEELRNDTGNSKRNMCVVPELPPDMQKSTLVNIKYATAE